MRWPRILLWSALMVAVLLSAHLIFIGSRETPTIAGRTAWIGLPKYGTDASDIEVRHVIFDSLEMTGPESSYEPLAKKCWKYGEETSPEIYAITRPAELIPNHSRGSWRIELEVNDEKIKVSKWEFPGAFLSLHSPLNEDVEPVANTGVPPEYLGRQVFYLPKSELAVLANGWKTMGAWNERQHATSCTDSYGIQFEACVNGKYGIRETRCGEPRAGDNEFIEAIYSRLLDYKPRP